MATFEQQLQELIDEYDAAARKSEYGDVSDIFSLTEVTALETRCLAAIERTGGRSSVYFQTAEKIDRTRSNPWQYLAIVVGIVRSLSEDVKKGYLKSIEELIHGDVFSDFLEMASHLVGSGYKDAAAVIAGSTLESHLRQLATKNSVPLDVGGTPKKAETLNAELAKAVAYSKLDQKNVTAWLGLRNDAAHGNYSAYDKNQVVLLIASVRDFITRRPA